MNATVLTKHYGNLTGDERFRLILAASGRGDEAERERLGNAGRRIALEMLDHAPYAHAFHEFSLTYFLVLLEDAACVVEELDWVTSWKPERDQEDQDGEAKAEAETDPGRITGETERWGEWEQLCDLTMVTGYMLKINVAAWEAFCKRLSIPPRVLWAPLPGFDRLQRALVLAEKFAFTDAGFLQWLNGKRAADVPEIVKNPVSVEEMADKIEQRYRERVSWWGG